MFPLYFVTKENIEIFKIQMCAGVTYEHLKLAQGKRSLTITQPKGQRKIRIWISLYVIKRKSD